MSEAQLLLLRQRQRERELEEQKRREELGIQPESTSAEEAQQEHREVMDVDEEDDTRDDNSPHHINNPEEIMPSGMFPPNPTYSNETDRNVPSAENVLNGSNQDISNHDQEPTAKKQNRKSKHGMYQDIEEMMFGFGDSWPPAPDSVELIEDLAVKYIKDLCQRALEVADYTGKLDKQCFMYAVRKDTRKFSRAYALLKANDELKTARTSTIAEEEKHIEALRTTTSTQFHHAENNVAPEAEGTSASSHAGNDPQSAGGAAKGGRGGGGRGKGHGGRSKVSGEQGDVSADGAGRGRGRGGGGGRGRGRGGRGKGKGSDATDDVGNVAMEPSAAALTIEPDGEN